MDFVIVPPAADRRRWLRDDAAATASPGDPRPSRPIQEAKRILDDLEQRVRRSTGRSATPSSITVRASCPMPTYASLDRSLRTEAMGILKALDRAASGSTPRPTRSPTRFRT